MKNYHFDRTPLYCFVCWFSIHSCGQEKMKQKIPAHLTQNHFACFKTPLKNSNIPYVIWKSVVFHSIELWSELERNFFDSRFSNSNYDWMRLSQPNMWTNNDDVFLLFNWSKAEKRTWNMTLSLVIRACELILKSFILSSIIFIGKIDI